MSVISGSAQKIKLISRAMDKIDEHNLVGDDTSGFDISGVAEIIAGASINKIKFDLKELEDRLSELEDFLDKRIDLKRYSDLCEARRNRKIEYFKEIQKKRGTK